jgi:hypothetical protein
MFALPGMCLGQFVSLQCVMVKIARFSITGMFCGQNHQFQHGLNMMYRLSMAYMCRSWSKLSVSTGALTML